MTLYQCPCGTRPEISTYYRDTGKYSVEWWFVYCPSCSSRTGLIDEVDEAIRVWNSDFGSTKPGYKHANKAST